MIPAPAECILCGARDRSLLFRQDRWHVYRCDSCHLGFLDPQPDPDELNSLYQQSYFHDIFDDGLKVGSPEMARRLVQEDHRIRFFRGKKRRGRILDIGCGMGYFLFACRLHGYEVGGVDISDFSAAYVRQELQIDVATGPIETIRFAPGSVDVVTMWHFLEHTADPREYLVRAREWLKPDGLLVVDVPNYEGTDARIARDRWKGWHLPYHLFHFTPQALQTLLARYGFQILRTKAYLSECVRERLEAHLLLRPFARTVAKFYSGHSFAALARRI